MQDGPEPLCRLRGLRRVYPGPDGPVKVLAGLDLDVQVGERMVVTGASGAGKTTLLSVLGMVDPGFEGVYAFRGEDTRAAGERRRSRWRLQDVGYAFQDLHLVPSLSAEENVRLPAEARGASAEEAKERAARLLEAAGLGHRLHHRPASLSGGERRRTALARALANRPALLLLDEPTDGLDAVSREGVLGLVDQAGAEGAAVVVATHEPELFPGRRLALDGGRLVPS